MGEVWKGVHVAQNVPVAIKIIKGEAMRRADHVEAFGNEVRAVAGLDHPGIVVVLDYGEITAEAEQASDGRLVEGSPYLIMEYAERGCLAEYMPYVGWPEVRELLIGILDALAHAHARGVIHRDLKPENILVGCSGANSVKLSDFGLAHVPDRFERSGNVEACWGTPQYMAPEQLRGLWRDYGPWTDLYALGCMVYELVTGELPFEAKNVWELGQAHIMLDPPALKARIALPEGFEIWLRRLLKKEPGERFQFAADAAYALARLGDPPGEDPDKEPPARRPSRLGAASDTERNLAHDAELGEPTMLLPHLDLAPTLRTPTVTFDITRWLQPAATTTTVPEASCVDRGFQEVPPLPTNWRRPSVAAQPVQLLGAGLGLYGLRAIPMVDRDAERDQIWELLSAVGSEESARVVLVRGSAGTGKTRLAQWICERAHEVGAAAVLCALHSPMLGPADGIEGMLARHLRCVRLSRAEIFERTRDIVRRQGIHDTYEWNALTELITPIRSADEADLAVRTVRFFSSRQRHALIYRHLQRLAAQRPVIVWMDDVQWGSDALALVGHILEAQQTNPSPLLVLMTARDEAFRDRPIERSLLAELLDDARVSVCEVNPLPKTDSLELVRQLLGLDGELARHVEARSGGIPLYAIQLVGDWVAQGKLVLGQVGFEVRPGEDIEIPDDIHAIWSERIQTLVDELGGEAQIALEAAAALGQDVDEREWQKSCSFLQASIHVDFVSLLIDAGLGRALESGWAFVHGMLRESIERSSKEQGRWEHTNAACAHMLYHLYSPRDLGVSERYAWHITEAGWPGEALEPLLIAAERSLERSDFGKAHALLDRREEIIEHLGLPDSDPSTCQGWIRRAALFEQQGRFGDALKVSREAVFWAIRCQWQDLLARALLQQGLAERRLGRLDQSAQSLQMAQQIFAELVDEPGLASAGLGLARVAEEHGEYERAEALFGAAQLRFEHQRDMLGVAQCLNGLGDIARQSGDFASAQRYAEQARSLSEQLGNQIGVADCLNDIADWRRLQGDFDGALEQCLEAVALYESLGSDQSTYARLNLGLIYLHQRRFDDSHEVFEELEAQLRRNQHWSLLAHVLVGLLPGYGQQGDWAAWDYCFEEAVRLLEQSGINDPNISTSAFIAAEIATQAGERARAQRVTHLARTHYEGVSLSPTLRTVRLADE